MKSPKGFVAIIATVVVALLIGGAVTYVAVSKNQARTSGSQAELKERYNELVAEKAQLESIIASEKVKEDTTSEYLSGQQNVAKNLQSIQWHIADPDPKPGDNAYQALAQSIALDVFFTDGTSQRYPVGEAAGCGSSVTRSVQGTRTIFGTVNCYAMLIGIQFTAYSENGTFFVESFMDDASGQTAGTRSIRVQFPVLVSSQKTTIYVPLIGESSLSPTSFINNPALQQSAYTEGTYFGCGVSIFLMPVEVPFTNKPINATLNTLFALPSSVTYNNKTYSNPLANQVAQKGTTFIRADLVGSVLKIYLASNGGIGIIGNECGNPALEAQFRLIKMPYPNITNVQVYIDGQLFDWNAFLSSQT